MKKKLKKIIFFQKNLSVSYRKKRYDTIQKCSGTIRYDTPNFQVRYDTILQIFEYDTIRYSKISSTIRYDTKYRHDTIRTILSVSYRKISYHIVYGPNLNHECEQSCDLRGYRNRKFHQNFYSIHFQLHGSLLSLQVKLL